MTKMTKIHDRGTLYTHDKYFLLIAVSHACLLKVYYFLELSSKHTYKDFRC